MPFHIRRISFEELRDYWLEVKHFHVPDKVITRYVPALGPYRCTIENPRIQEYGLFDRNLMIGGTMIQQWSDGVIRWRTNNIRAEYRGQDLFYLFLNRIIKADWHHEKKLIGWFRQAAYGWAQKHGFSKFDSQWHNHDGDRYILVSQSIGSFLQLTPEKETLRNQRVDWKG